VLTGLNFLNYLDRFIPAAVLPAIVADLHCRARRRGRCSWSFILAFAVISPLFGWLGDRRARFPAGRRIGVLVWSVATVGSGLATTFALLHRGARADRRRRGELHGRHALADLGLLPRSTRGRALALFYARDPDRLGVRRRPRRARSTRTGVARGVLRRGRAGRGAGGVLLMFRDPVRGSVRPP
jgi:MFS family permease